MKANLWRTETGLQMQVVAETELESIALEAWMEQVVDTNNGSYSMPTRYLMTIGLPRTVPENPARGG